MIDRARFIAGSAAMAGVAALPRTSAAAERITVAIGPGHSMIYVPWDLAAALGYFTREGLEPDFQFLRGGSEASAALSSGAADFAGCGVDHAILAQLRGKDIPLIAQ